MTRTTQVVTPQSCIGIRLQRYGHLGVTLRSHNAVSVFHIVRLFHSPAQALLTQPLMTVTFASVTLRARTAVDGDEAA
ncbi:predicted protein [Streptomyces sviceus ATCC 29083]|uniref:Uncharacterized protein n=1 Tax=Streptomyces sviceus (strain ATCC 29083 / DSM 924 / JCM 4929 / NBRC 13980 / NCIMB 11184 / NRRL 5439 / UC 5370) TaxID=463191 RepID=D6XAG9_STRX2|nr:predicted protein [Streptomyces sviceus ATCC 29083]